MRTLLNQKVLLAVFTVIFLFLLPNTLLAQGPPPPPGVPIDGGVSLLVAAAVGYGVVKMRQKNQSEDIQD